MTDDSSQPTSNTTVSGGVNVDAQRDVNVGGDVVGRDKIVDESITTGDIKDVSGVVAVGNNINVTVTSTTRGASVEDYLVAVREFCANLPYLTLQDIRPSKKLEDVYVPLSLRSWQHNEGKKVADDQGGANQDVLRPGTLSIAEVMRSQDVPHLLVLGEPGSGKSSLLRHLAERAWIKHDAIGLDKPHLPLFVQLRQLALANGMLDERLRTVLNNGLTLSRAIPEGFLEEWPKQTNARWLILFDALDEVPGSASAEFMLWLNGQLRLLAAHSVVITSRLSSFVPVELLDEGTFNRYEVRPFGPDQIQDFAEKWFPDTNQEFIAELDRLRFDLQGEPLLLTIAAKVFIEKERLPERLSNLYHEFVRIWLEEASQKDRLKNELGGYLSAPKIDTYIDRLAHLALRMTQEPISTSLEKLSGFVAESLPKSADTDVRRLQVFGEHFVEVMAQRSGVFVERRGVYEFIHPTFREYLAAYDVVHVCEYNPELVWERAVSRWEEKEWIQVALFALNILNEKKDITSLVDNICRSDDIRWPFVATMSILVSKEIGAETIDRAIRGLIALARSDYWQSYAISALFALHERPRAMQGLLVLARDADMPPWWRVRIAEWLSELPGQADKVALILLALARGFGLEYTGAHGAAGTAIDALARLRRQDELLLLVNGADLDIDVRLYAAKKLGELGRADDAGVAVLAMLPGLYDSAKTRVEVAEVAIALGRGNETATILRSVMNDTSVDAWDRAFAAKTLARVGYTTEALDIVRILAQDPDKDARVHEMAAETLAELDQVDESAVIFRALVSDGAVDIWTRVHAAKALCKFGQAESAVPILTTLADEKDASAYYRMEIAETLGELGEMNRAIDILLALAKDTHAESIDRRLAADALVKLDQVSEAFNILLDLAHTTNAEIDDRIRAIEALIELDKTDDAKAVLIELADERRLEAGNQIRVAEMLSKLGEVSIALKSLLPLTLDLRTETGERKRAIKALGELGRSDESADKEIAPALFSLSRNLSDDQVTVDAAIEALGSLGWVSKLHSLLDDKDIDVWRRARAAEVLGQGDQAASLYLEQATGKNGLWIANKLAGLGWFDESVALLFTQALNRNLSNTTNRLSAARALGRVGRIDEAATILIALASEPGDKKREYLEVIEALGELDRVDDLRLLAHESRLPGKIQRQAARTLGRLGYVEAAAEAWVAIAQSGDISPGFPLDPGSALGELGRIDELRRLVNDRDVDISVRIECAEALGKLGQADEASTILLPIALDDSETAWSQSGEAIRALGELNRIRDLLVLLHDETLDEWRRVDVIRALGRRADAAALPVLDQIAETDHDRYVRERAQTAAKDIRRRLGIEPTDSS